MKIEFYGKTALVTGAAGCIGYTIAQTLLESGAKVAMIDVNERAVEAAAEQLSELGTVHAYVADLRETDLFGSLVSQIHEELGPISILVQAAGLMEKSPDTEEANRLEISRTSVALSIMQQVVERSMAVHGGAILNFSTQMDRHTIASLSLQCAQVWKGQRIRVNVILPSGDLFIRPQAALGDSVSSGHSPLWRSSIPQELANLTAFLSSDKAECISGQIFMVDSDCFTPESAIPPIRRRQRR